jgi:hypothetical protein
MDGLRHLLGKRSARIVLATLVAAALLFVVLLSVERSGPSPLHSSTTSHSGNTATTAATTTKTNGNNQGTSGSNQGNGNNQGQNCNANNNQGKLPRCPSGS